MDKPSRRPMLSVNKPDPLKHFSKDGPLVRLTALLIDRLPMILWTAGFAAAVLARASGYW